MDLLVENGALVNAKIIWADPFGLRRETGLHKGIKRIDQIFVFKRSGPTLRDNSGDTSLHIAVAAMPDYEYSGPDSD